MFFTFDDRFEWLIKTDSGILLGRANTADRIAVMNQAISNGMIRSACNAEFCLIKKGEI